MGKVKKIIRKIPFSVWMIVGIIVGIGIGVLSGLTYQGTLAGYRERADAAIIRVLASMYINAIKFIMIPNVFISVLSAVTTIGTASLCGRFGLSTIIYYLLSSFIAIIIGFILFLVINPGSSGFLETTTVTFTNPVASNPAGSQLSSVLNVFLSMVPDNFPKLLTSNGELLGLITSTVFIAIGILSLPNMGTRNTYIAGIRKAQELVFQITPWVLNISPLGIIFVIARPVGEIFVQFKDEDKLADFVKDILLFVGTVVGSLLIHFVVQNLALLLIGKKNPLKYLSKVAPALIFAISSASSSATIPLTLKHTIEAGSSPLVASFVVPIGATINMDGTALYECVAALFICNAYGANIGIANQFLVIVLALLSSIGVAGIPQASLVAINLILVTVGNSINLNLAAGIGVIYIFDRPLDMLRTMINIYGDSVASTVLTRIHKKTLEKIDHKCDEDKSDYMPVIID